MVAPPQVIGRYAVFGKIASGGMASVHLGRLLGSVGFARTVAIKRLHPHLAEEPEFLSTMIDEARLAARINHPNVVPTLDVVAVDSELLVVMEYIRGESLARLLAAERAHGGSVPLPVASAIVAGALHGLHAAHEATDDHGARLDIVHRDVSPQNVLVGVDGVPRVIDFGVAKAAGRLTATSQGVIKGKVAYMAPEQLGGVTTRRIDVYAAAVVLWEMLAGKRLFRAENEAALMTLILRGADEPPSRYASNVPPELDELVMKGLALEPLQRFATAREMAETLMRVCPPAFPTDVGAWVANVARDALARRTAVLAEIESSSNIVAVPAPPPSLRTGALPVPVVEEAGLLTTASQASSLSVEAPGPRVVAESRSSRVMWGAGVGAGILLAATVAALVSRGGTPRARSAAAASAVTSAGPAEGESAAPGASPVASPMPPPTSETHATPSVTTPKPAGKAPAATAPSGSRARPTATNRWPPSPPPAASIRFAQPD